jgi:hypothetical protein
LILIRKLLEENNSDLDVFQLPLPQHEFAPVLTHEWRLLHEQRNFDIPLLRETVLHDSARLNPDQLHAYTILCDAVNAEQGGIFFLDEFGGTGKTFVINLTLAKIRSEGHIALAVASSGIVATLLDGRTTAHSRFKIPIDIDVNSTCYIPAQGPVAGLIREISLVIWDEAVMQRRYVFEAVGRSFRDIRQNNRPFGCVVVCFCGDFRQILPIIVKGTRSQIVCACLKHSTLWQHVQVLPLTINMRLLRPGLLPHERQQQEEFANRLLGIGEGHDIVDDCIHWPIESIVPNNSIQSLSEAIFPDLSTTVPSAAFLADRILLAPRNNQGCTTSVWTGLVPTESNQF